MPNPVNSGGNPVASYHASATSKRLEVVEYALCFVLVYFASKGCEGSGWHEGLLQRDRVRCREKVSNKFA